MTARYPSIKREGPQGQPESDWKGRWGVVPDDGGAYRGAWVALIGPVAVLLIVVVALLGFLLGRL